jgi:hypothetical protein
MNKSYNGMRSKSDLQRAVKALKLAHYKGLASKSISELVQILTEAAANPDAEDDMDLTNAIAEISELLGDDGTSYFGPTDSEYTGMHVVDDAEDDEDEETMRGIVETGESEDVVMDAERRTRREQKRKTARKEQSAATKRQRRTKC